MSFMKKINTFGLEVKAYKEFVGHDGAILSQGNLYLNNKKVGFITDEDMSGMVDLRVLPQFKELVGQAYDAFKKELNSLYGKYLPSYMTVDDMFASSTLLEFAEMKQRTGRKKEVQIIATVKGSDNPKVTVHHPRDLRYSINRQRVSPDVAKFVVDKEKYLQYAVMYGRNAQNGLDAVFFTKDLK